MRSASAWAWRSRRLVPLSIAAALALWAVAPAGAVVYLSQREALELAFPDAEQIDRRSYILSEDQARAIEALARAPLESRLVALHTAKRDGLTLGYALIDVHTVRTLPEALMVVLSAEGEVQSVRVLAFHEPTDYQPPHRWYEQFAGRTLSPDLQLKRGIDGISGATLSARAATRTVRRALAYHRVLRQDPRVAGSE